jgi:hypothetical protein
MFVDAGGHLIPGGNTNAQRVPGVNLFQEMAIHADAGVTPMQTIQGATKWSAEMINKGNELGTVEAGKIADVIIIDQDPLQNVQNLKTTNTVIFDGKVVELGYNSHFTDPFRRMTPNRPVDALEWVAAYRRVVNPGGGGGTNLPDPAEAPQPAIETINPVMVTEGSPTTTVTIRGFSFVRRSQVLFKGISVPYKVVRPTELQVTLDARLLREVGTFELVVKNPSPIAQGSQMWGNGTSNKAQLIVNYKY